MNLNKKLIYVLVILIIIFSLARFINLESSVGVHWQGQFNSYVSLKVAEGDIPYKDFKLIYPPIGHLLIAFLMSIFGKHLIISLLFANFVAILSIFSVYLIGSLYNKQYGIISAFLLSIGLIFTENVFYLEMISILFILIAAYIILRYKTNLPLFISGILMSIAFFTKQTSIILVLAALLYLIYKKRYKNLLAYVLGLLAFTLIFILIFFRLTGSLEFLTKQILYQISHPIKRSLFLKSFQLINILIQPFYFLSIITIFYLIYKKFIKKEKLNEIVTFSIILSMLFLAFIIFRVQQFSEYYLILIIPFLSLILAEVISRIKYKGIKELNILHFIIIIFIILTIISGPITSISKQIAYFPKEHNKIIKVSNYLKEITNKSDNIFLDNNVILFYANRKKTGKLYDTSSAYKYDPNNEFITDDEKIEAIKNEKPKIITISGTRLNFLYQYDYFNENYKFIESIEGHKFYKLKENTPKGG